MADSKWFIELPGETPLAVVARLALESRLDGLMGHLFSPAGENPVEQVHQLRVGTRRAGAALDIFETCLGKKSTKSLRRVLKKTRRTAGAVRDWDVFIAMIERLRPQFKKENAGLDFLIGVGYERRTKAQLGLQEWQPKVVRDYPGLVEETLNAAKIGGARKKDLLMDSALPHLEPLFKNLEKAAQKNLNVPENLHPVRILGKELRYRMEIFVGCFQPPFRQALYPSIEKTQEILGASNDSVVALRHLEEIRDQAQVLLGKDFTRIQKGIEAVLHHHRESIPRLHKEFLSHWEKWKKLQQAHPLKSLLLAPQSLRNGKPEAVKKPKEPAKKAAK